MTFDEFRKDCPWHDDFEWEPKEEPQHLCKVVNSTFKQQCQEENCGLWYLWQRATPKLTDYRHHCAHCGSDKCYNLDCLKSSCKHSWQIEERLDGVLIKRTCGNCGKKLFRKKLVDES